MYAAEWDKYRNTGTQDMYLSQVEDGTGTQDAYVHVKLKNEAVIKGLVMTDDIPRE